jgi:hypothetical protein
VRRKDAAGFAFGRSLNGQTARFGFFIVAIKRKKAPGEFCLSEGRDSHHDDDLL